MASEFYDRMQSALEGDMNRTAMGSRDLQEVRARLERLDLLRLLPESASRLRRG